MRFISFLLLSFIAFNSSLHLLKTHFMKSFFTLLSISFSSLIFAQNTLIGKVTNLNNEPLLGVEVFAPKLHKGTTTDIDGNYKLKDLPNGTITIVFGYVGFTSQSKSVVFTSKQLELNIQLKESVFTMDEVIVSTPFNKLQSENVMKVEHKSIAQLQRQGAPTLMEGLTSIAGVSQVSTGVSIGKPVIRGLTGNRVLVYAQGVRLENQQFGDEHGLGLNDAGVESVEVIKGPASLLYGSDALGGVLYFNPEKFSNSHVTIAGIHQKYFSNTQGSNTSFYIKSATEKFKFLARMTYNSHLDYKIPNGSRITNTRFNEYDIKTGFQYSNEHFSSTLRYNYNLLNLGINEGEINEQSLHRNPNFPKQKVHNHIISVHNHLFFENSSLDADIGYLFNDRSEFEDTNNPSLQMLLNTINYTVKYNLPKFGAVEIISGLQGMHQTNTNKATEILIPNATINDIGGFATANYQWKNNTIQGGLRFDSRDIKTETHGVDGEIGYVPAINQSFSSFNASAGYKNDLSEKTVIRINVATGFRAPNLAELTSNGIHEGTNRFEIGNAELKNEQNYQTDIAVEYKNEHIEFFANGFYNAIDNYIFLSPTGETIENTDVFRYKQDNAILYGGEFGFHLHPHPLDWLHFESSFETVIGKQKNDTYLPLIPANKLNNTLRAEFEINQWFQKGYTALKLESTFKQHHVSTFETFSKCYNLVNFSLGGNIKLKNIQFNLSMNITNLLDTSYISHLSRLKGDGIVNIGRSFVLALDFKI